MRAEGGRERGYGTVIANRKRFYRTADVEPTANGYRITLDGRPLRTPAGAEFVLPSAQLASAVAAEWLAQSDEVRPLTMPATRLAATAVDRVAAHREAVIDHMVAYGGSDMLCYRAEEPGALAARQHGCWQPLLDWASQDLRAALVVTQGVMPVEQPRAALDALRQAVGGLDDFELTALGSAVPACGSLVLGLALIVGRLSAEDCFQAAQLDESFQVEQWGDDDELAERRTGLRHELLAAAEFLACARERRLQ